MNGLVRATPSFAPGWASLGELALAASDFSTASTDFGRALGVGEVKFADQVLPTVRKVVYGIDLKRVFRGKLVLGIADGWLEADGKVIYEAKDLRVGLFQAGGAPA